MEQRIGAALDALPDAGVSTAQPKISAVVAALNEERHITACIEGLLAQRDVGGPIEILVVDGGSSDRTVAVVRALPGYGSRIHLLQNPRRLQVYAWNIGWRAARGEFVGLISAHAQYAPDYFQRCLEVAERTGAANVGGVQRPIGEGPLGTALAWAMASPLAMGNATFRYTTREQDVDSVFGGFFRREFLAVAGGYDETNHFDEDGEINYRLRKAGHRIVVSPAIVNHYRVRNSFASLARQMYRYGFWRPRTLQQHPGAVPLRVFAPPALVAGLALALPLACTKRGRLALALPASYLAFLALASCKALRSTRSPGAALSIPAVLATMHIAYGIGFWIGLVRHNRADASRTS